MSINFKSKSELYDAHIALIAVFGAVINSIALTITKFYFVNKYSLLNTLAATLGRLIGDTPFFILIFILVFFSLKFITSTNKK